jgi:hypothetical protein
MLVADDPIAGFTQVVSQGLRVRTGLSLRPSDQWVSLREIPRSVLDDVVVA